jgi:hypothetical protein
MRKRVRERGKLCAGDRESEEGGQNVRVSERESKSVRKGMRVGEHDKKVWENNSEKRSKMCVCVCVCVCVRVKTMLENMKLNVKLKENIHWDRF